MAKIISSRKKYVPVKDLKVYPSNKETIEVIPDDCNGAHRYRAQTVRVISSNQSVSATGIVFFESRYLERVIPYNTGLPSALYPQL